MKGKWAIWSVMAALFLFSGLFFTQTADVAMATSTGYIEFQGAANAETAIDAAVSVGTSVAQRQKQWTAQQQEMQAAAKAYKGKEISLDSTKPMIALTFDDGPNGVTTERILNVLEKYNGRGTFFLVGNRIGNHQALLQRMVQNGHELGNHSYSHQNFSKSSASVIKGEISNTQRSIAAALGQEYAAGVPRLARIPYGANGSGVGKAVGMPMIQWSVDTKDWSTKNAAKTVSAILENAKDGDIILMHDLHEPTAKACETVIPKLVEKGFQLVTVSELFEAKGIPLAPGVIYYKAR